MSCTRLIQIAHNQYIASSKWPVHCRHRIPPLDSSNSGLITTDLSSDLILVLVFNWIIKPLPFFKSQPRKTARCRIRYAIFILRESPIGDSNRLQQLFQSAKLLVIHLMNSDVSRTSCEHSSPPSVHTILLTTSKLSALGVASSAAVVPVLIVPGNPGII